MNIPEGFALIPKTMLLDKDTIQAINFHCGDGEDGQFGSYSDGSLWVGVITDDDGKEVHGLHIATAEYPEEGSTTLVEFAAPVVPQYTGTGSDSLDCILGVGGFASFGPLDQAKPAELLTIPGALEWDGTQGDHSAHGTHGESVLTAEGDTWPKLDKPAKVGVARFAVGVSTRLVVGCAQRLYGFEVTPEKEAERIKVAQAFQGGMLLSAERDQLQRDMTERDQRIDELESALNQAYMALIGYLPGHRNSLTDAAIAACSAALLPNQSGAACSRCGGWGHIETEDSAHDCPECGPSVVERAVEAGVMNAPAQVFECIGKGGEYRVVAAAIGAGTMKAHDCLFVYRNQEGIHFVRTHDDFWARMQEIQSPPKQKVCIECDQPYCHGVCVERGDQDYDRDQAARGGDDE